MSIWREEEIRYLQTLENSCIELSREYHIIYFKRRTSQNKFKIPAIIIGSFTGVASFGSSAFPPHFQKWISISVGLINVAIAILNTLESFLQLGEELNASKSASEQLKKLAEDINRELSLEISTRQTSGVIFLRDSYTRYQQILSTAPILSRYISYLVGQDEDTDKQSLTQKILTVLSRQKQRLSRMPTTRNSIDIESGEPNIIQSRSMDLLSTKHRNFSLHNIQDHLNYVEIPPDSPMRSLSPQPMIEQQPIHIATLTNQNIQAQAGLVETSNIRTSDGSHDTRTTIEIEDNDGQSNRSSSNSETRLKKLKQLTRIK